MYGSYSVEHDVEVNEFHDVMIGITVKCTARTWQPQHDDPGSPSEWEIMKIWRISGEEIKYRDLVFFLGQDEVDLLVDETVEEAIERSGL